MPKGKGQHSGDVGRWWVIWGLRDYESQTLLGDLGIKPVLAAARRTVRLPRAGSLILPPRHSPREPQSSRPWDSTALFPSFPHLVASLGLTSQEIFNLAVPWNLLGSL